jgi:RNA polymerase sigma factor (sigma-70 family)
MYEQAQFSPRREAEIMSKVRQRLRMYLARNRDVNGVEFSEDLEQEAWIKIMTAFHQGTEITDAVAARCADTAFANWREKEANQTRGAEQLTFPQSVPTEALEDLRGTAEEPTMGPDQEFAAELAKITTKICNDEREAAIAMLLFYHNLREGEIADKLEIPRDNVRTIIYRLRLRAKDLLGVDIEVTR